MLSYSMTQAAAKYPPKTTGAPQSTGLEYLLDKYMTLLRLRVCSGPTNKISVMPYRQRMSTSFYFHLMGYANS